MTSTGEDVVTAALRVEHDGPVATILMDHPRRRNALTQSMWQSFEPILKKLEDDPTVKVVVVRGAGGDFSAGADISDLKAILHDTGTGRHDGGHVTAGENALARFPKPTIAAIDGYCFGGAWQVAGACDIRIASTNASIGITPSKIGIVYPLSGIDRLVRLVGPATAKYLLFSGDQVPADKALTLGLVSDVVLQEEFWNEIDAIATRLATRSQLSIRAMKQIVDAVTEGADLDPVNARWQDEMALSGEPDIGIGAFLAKEAPRFAWTGPSRAMDLD